MLKFHHVLCLINALIIVYRMLITKFILKVMLFKCVHHVYNLEPAIIFNYTNKYLNNNFSSILFYNGGFYATLLKLRKNLYGC